MRIGFSGKQRAGKDTSAEYLVNKYLGFIMKFADPIYDIEESAYHLAGLGSPEKYPKSMRRGFLQFIGTEWGRKVIDPNIWINVMDEKLSRADSKHVSANLFVTDVRFPNEAELLRKHGFKIIRVNRPLDARLQAGATNLDHESETVLDNYDFDCVINNDNGYSELYQKLEKTIERFKA